MIRKINGESTFINPTYVEQGLYQKHGLTPSDRKPNDYLRMVARTFTAFKNTNTNDTVVSYINGFEVYCNEEVINEIVDWVPTDVTYNVFKVNRGVCLIDNQLIDIYEDSYFYKALSEWNKNTKYAIIVEYDYIEQYKDNYAFIRFVPYNDLTFPNAENKSECTYIDYSLSSSNSTIINSGKPGLVIATFSTNAKGEIIQSDTSNGEVHGIDPQYLSKLYIQNYKLLFEYFGAQANSIFSSMGMTQATFMSVGKERLHSELQSGDLCYFDSVTNQYRKAIASRQKFSKVIGLYLHEIAEDNHLIYLNGYITIDAIKHNLPANHTLLNLRPGSHYYLEDSCSLFDSNNTEVTIDNYVLLDSAGRITPAFFPGAVRVGYSTACNQLVLDIDHSLEIGTGNLIGLYGTFDEYKKEFLANRSYFASSYIMDTAATDIVNLGKDIVTYNNQLGTDLNIEIATFLNNHNTFDELNLIFNYLTQYFHNGFGVLDILSITPGLSNSISSKIDPTKVNDIKTNLLKYNKLINIGNLLNGLSTVLEQEQTLLKTNLTQWYSSNLSNYSNVLNNKLKIARMQLGDNPDILENFENKNIDITVDTTVYDYSGNISSLNLENTNYLLNNDNRVAAYDASINIINQVTNQIEYCNTLYSITKSLIDDINNKITLANSTITNNQKIISDNALIKTKSANDIVSVSGSRLDIFLMSEHQRTIYNYTYITDRLRKALYNNLTLNEDLTKKQVYLDTVLTNPETTVLEKIAAQQEVERVKNQISSNTALIDKYTLEYNEYRVNSFGIAPITKYDINFDDGGYADERIGTYRYGCDTQDSYNGLAGNYFPTCESNAFIRMNIIDPSNNSTPTITGRCAGIIGSIEIEFDSSNTSCTIIDNTFSCTLPQLTKGKHIVRASGIDSYDLGYTDTIVVEIL